MTSIFWLFVDKLGCGTYRVRIPASSLEQKGFSSSFRWQEECITMDEVLLEAQEADIVVFQRCVGLLYVDLMKELKRRGISCVFEMDDLLFDVPRHNPASWIWRKKPIQKMLKNMLNMSDAIIVSTLPLAERVQLEVEDITKIHVCHNSLHPAFWEFGAFERRHINTDLIIGWQGSTTHDTDFKEALPALKRIIDERPDVKLRLFGDVPRSVRGCIQDHRFEWTGGVPYDSYPSKLWYCNFDIGIAPVTRSIFNSCKSNIKWLEYSAIRVPTVASRVYPYERSIVEGKTGMLASSEEEWYQNLSILLNDMTLRRQIGDNAYTEVWKNWSAETHVEAWASTFKSLVGQKVDV